MLFSTCIILVGSHDTFPFPLHSPCYFASARANRFPWFPFFFSLPPFFFLLTHFVDVISLFFHRVCMCVCVCMRARMWVCIYVLCVFMRVVCVCLCVCAARVYMKERKDARVCMYLNASVSVNPYRIVIVLPYYMHSYVLFFSLSYVISLRVRVSVMLQWQKKRGLGRSGGKSKEEVLCIGVSVYFLSFFFLYVYFVCIYLIWSVCLFVCFFLHTYIYIHIHAYRHIYIHTYVYTYMDVCTHMYVRMYTLVSFIKIYKRECLCIHIYVHIYL